jgi:transglutaminase-like putative cysteine protease
MNLDFRTFPRDDVVMDGTGPADWLKPGALIDSEHPDIVAWARSVVDDAGEPREKALRLYHAVRDDVRYDPYTTPLSPEAYKASATLAAGHGYCINKAGLMAATCRAVGVPARVGYADVRNHMTTTRMTEFMGTDVFYFHGYVDIGLDGRWIKATPAFNRQLTERFGLKPLEWDGQGDSIYHPYDMAGRRHMEYLAYRGVYADIPFDTIAECFRREYPKMHAAMRGGAIEGDFAAEGEAETKTAARA